MRPTFATEYPQVWPVTPRAGLAVLPVNVTGPAEVGDGSRERRQKGR
jgi:hypothetical protein